MAITYNSYDKVHYGTAADKAADVKIVATATAKFFEYDTDTLYVSDGTTWHVVS